MKKVLLTLLLSFIIGGRSKDNEKNGSRLYKQRHASTTIYTTTNSRFNINKNSLDY